MIAKRKKKVVLKEVEKMLEKIRISSNQFFLKQTLKKNTKTLRKIFTNMYFPVFSQFAM